MSKTRLFQAIKALDADAVAALLHAQPELIRAVDDRRRNPLHFLCSLPADPRTSARALALARRLLDAGLDVNAPAFVGGRVPGDPALVRDLAGQQPPARPVSPEARLDPGELACGRPPSPRIWRPSTCW